MLRQRNVGIFPFDHSAETDEYGFLVDYLGRRFERIHRIEQCQRRPNRACVFHAPSVHHMRNWPLHLRETGLIERLCPHGIGHPDPDSLAYFLESDLDYSRHGCDGCCRSQEGS
jgi:hypothetical protein